MPPETQPTLPSSAPKKKTATGRTVDWKARERLRSADVASRAGQKGKLLYLAHSIRWSGSSARREPGERSPLHSSFVHAAASRAMSEYARAPASTGWRYAP